MAAFVLPYTVQRFFDSDGLPLAGGKIYSYAAGTSSALALYTNVGLTVPFSNPIILDSQGSVGAPMYMKQTPAYKIDVKNAAGVSQDGYPADNISAPPVNPADNPLNAAPTIASGFGTGANIVNILPTPLGFLVDVGFGGVATQGVIGLPTSLAGWVCCVNNLTAAGAHRASNTRQIASSVSSVTLENQTTSTGAAIAWTASDVLILSCFPF